MLTTLFLEGNMMVIYSLLVMTELSVALPELKYIININMKS